VLRAPAGSPEATGLSHDVAVRREPESHHEVLQVIHIRRAGDFFNGLLEANHPVYIAPGPLNALEVLRRAYEGGPERFGERGWRTGRELTGLIAELNRRGGARHITRVDSMELKWLADVGLAEKRDEKLAWGRDQPVVYWRVSASGRAVRVLTWRDSR
jgi:hypothetical protein